MNVIGKRARESTGDEPVAELLACHARIREVVAIARRLAAAAEPPLDEVAAAATRVRRYLVEALPRHVADEEQSLLPRLRGRGAELDRALAVMHGEHRDHDELIAAMIARCDALIDAPARHRELAAELAQVAAALDAAFTEHLDVEERVIFPALAALPADERAAVRAEMRARRGVST